MVYHHVNAFEEDGHVVFDVIAYDDNSLYDMFYLDRLKDKSGTSGPLCKPKFKRFVLPLTDKVLWFCTILSLVFNCEDELKYELFYL